MNAQSAVTGIDVTFFNTATAYQARGNISITGDAVRFLRAPRAGPQEGVLIWEDRSIVDLDSNHIDGQAASNIEGVIYMPNSDVNFTGGTGVSPGRQHRGRDVEVCRA